MVPSYEIQREQLGNDLVLGGGVWCGSRSHTVLVILLQS